jgi:hypothetical protein
MEDVGREGKGRERKGREGMGREESTGIVGYLLEHLDDECERTA